VTDFNPAIDKTLVAGLLAEQFPEWSHLPLAPVESAGTDNAMYRLGDDMAVRLPRVGWATGFIEKEVRWLPKLAPHLPLALPVPIAMGEPGNGYASHWSVVNWLDGENATLDRLADPRQAATRLGEFVFALQRLDTAGGPLSGEQNLLRGVPLAVRDPSTRDAIAALGSLFDIGELTTAWDSALRAPTWDGPPVWLHCDLQSGNLLAIDGQLTAVIDFGVMGVGDPACDAMAAWSLFSGESRKAFRAAMNVDDASWKRGRGWALSVAVIALAYYLNTNPVLAAMSRRAIEEVLADHR